jgi:preprotein translocase subunit SecE
VWRATDRSRAAIVLGRRAPGPRIIMANPFAFLQDTRTEAGKVTWPSRRETVITTVLVVLMVLFASAFFVGVDQALRLLVTFVLSLGH